MPLTPPLQSECTGRGIPISAQLQGGSCQLGTGRGCYANGVGPGSAAEVSGRLSRAPDPYPGRRRGHLHALRPKSDRAVQESNHRKALVELSWAGPVQSYRGGRYLPADHRRGPAAGGSLYPCSIREESARFVVNGTPGMVGCPCAKAAE